MPSPLRLAVLAAVLSATLSVATVSAAGHGGVKAPALKRGVTVYVWDPFPAAKNDPERAALQGAVRGWEKRTGDQVDLLGDPGNNDLKLCAEAAQGKAPDLIAVTHEQLSELRGCKSIKPVPAWAWPASAQGAYIDAATRSTRMGGRQWAMPWAIRSPVLFYNTSLVPRGFFAHSSVQWSKVIALARRLTDARKKQVGIAWDPTSFYLNYSFLSGAGGYIFRTNQAGYDSHSLGVDTRGSVSGLSYLRDLTTAGRYKLVSAKTTDPVAQDLFAAGKAAMYIGGAWDASYFTSFIKASHRTYTFATAPLPMMGSRVSHPLADLQVFVLNRYSGHPTESLSLLAYMTSHMQMPEYHAAGWIPVLRSALTSGPIARSPKTGGTAEEALLTQAVPNVSAMGVVWGPMNSAVSNVASGKDTPAHAARRAAHAIRAAITQAGF